MKKLLFLFILMFSMLSISVNADYVLDSSDQFASCTFTRTFWNTTDNSVQINNSFNNGTLTCQNLTTQTYNNWTIQRGLGWELHSELDGANLAEPLNTTGLIGYWDFNDAGNTIIDYSGNNNNATNTGATPNSTGKFNTAYDFEDTEDDYLTISDSPELDGMDAITISTWVKRESAGAVHYLFAKNTDFRVEDSYRAYIDSTNKLSWAPRDSCTAIFDGWETVSTINTGVWTHIAYIYDLGKVSIYINGVNQTLTTTGAILPTGAIATCNSNLYIGRRLGSTAMMDGLIDETMIFNRTLTPTEISNLYNRGATKLNATATLSTGAVYNISYGDTFSHLGTTTAENITLTFNFFAESSGLTYPKLIWSNVSTTSTGETITSNIDLLFAPKDDLTNYMTNFDTGEDLYTYINYTLSNGTIINNNTAVCNITMYDAYLSYDASDINFTLCGSGCDYTDTYSENITNIDTTNAVEDFIHFNGCHEQLTQGDMVLNISCNSGSYQDTILAGELPLCSVGTSFIRRNTTVCISDTWINLSLTYDGVNNRRKSITNLDIDRVYSEHTDSSALGEIIFNDTLNLWRQLDDHEYYEIGTKMIDANCSYIGNSSYDNSKTELISIDNSAPIITFGDLFLPLTTYVLTDGLSILYEAGNWTWTGSVNDLDGNLDYFDVSWYNSTGELIYSYLNNTGATELITPNATFIDFANPYNLTVFAIDTLGLNSTESITFTITSTTTTTTTIAGNQTAYNSILPEDWSSDFDITSTSGVLILFFYLAMVIAVLMMGVILGIPLLVILAGLMMFFLGFIIAFKISILFGIMVVIVGISLIFFGAVMLK